ncbi:MAG: PIN domain-containing protein [Chloroflexi bacterium]|nr:PIN domain-containing protein [Chloroflexota bacterium]
MNDKVFLDTAFVLALASPSDQYHEKAKELSHQIKKGGIALLTTRAILIEIGDAMTGQRRRKAGIIMLESLENDDNLEIFPNSEELYSKAFDHFAARPDKEWGMTDCISFVVMKEYEISEVLTTDVHFQQAGFVALMRE